MHDPVLLLQLWFVWPQFCMPMAHNEMVPLVMLTVA
jgi:hypothetical protein